MNGDAHQSISAGRRWPSPHLSQSMPAQQASLLLLDRPPVSGAVPPWGALALQQFFSAADQGWAVQENYPAHAVQPRQGGTGVAYVPNNVPFEGTSAYSVSTVYPAVLSDSVKHLIACQARAGTMLRHDAPEVLRLLRPVQLHCEETSSLTASHHAGQLRAAQDGPQSAAPASPLPQSAGKFDGTQPLLGLLWGSSYKCRVMAPLLVRNGTWRWSVDVEHRQVHMPHSTAAYWGCDRAHHGAITITAWLDMTLASTATRAGSFSVKLAPSQSALT